MIPIITPAEMAVVDAAATDPVDVLIARAGGAVARAAIDMMGGAYGRRVVVLAGKGNNGNDGRVAADLLRARGVRCTIVDASSHPTRLAPADLVIDAAYGTGFRGSYRAPDVESPVLAVDIPSGVNGLTGEVAERVLPAQRTVTFAALKPGLLVAPGSGFVGEVEVADIGLDVSGASAWFLEEIDVVGMIPARPVDAHKWQSAVAVVGGSAGLEGAASLTGRGALRSGAGYVRWSSPAVVPALTKPAEIVGVELPATDWASAVLDDAARFGAIALGNGLGLDPGHAVEVHQLVSASPVPVIIDADAITLLGSDADRSTTATSVITPHEAEFERLSGAPPGPDRFDAVRRLADRLGCVVLLKGPATIVAAPGGRVLVAAEGDQRLATLGTGDVLAGVIAALCARGVAPFEAAAAGAFLHGRASLLGWRTGLVAGDLVEALPAVFDQLEG